MRHGWRAAIGTIAAIAALAGTAQAADAALFWSEPISGIGRVDVDGTDRVWPLVQPDPPFGVATDDAYVYWAQLGDGTIGRARLDGTDVDPSFVDPSGSPVDVAVDGGFVYWVDDNNMFGRASTADGTVDWTWNFSLRDDVGALAARDSRLYWSVPSVSHIGRATIESGGTFVEPRWLGAAVRGGVAVTGDYIFWSDQDRIGRAEIDGSWPEPDFLVVGSAPSAPEVRGIAADDDHVYWADDARNVIERASVVDGSGRAALTTTWSDVFDLALGPALGAVAFGAAPSFAGQTVGTTSAPQAVTVTNTGEAPLDVGGVTLTGAGAGEFAIDRDACSGAAIAVGGTCDVTVRFAPRSVGAKAAALRLASNAASSPDELALTGTGLAPAPPPPPEITAIGPATGPPAGTAVTIEGSRLSSARQVLFGDIPARSFEIRGATRIMAVAPPGFPGVRLPVRVVGPGGTSNAIAFTYELPPPPPLVNERPSSGGPSPVPECVVPDVTGRTLRGAKRRLEAASCSVGETSRPRRAKRRRLRVRRQSQEPGAHLPHGYGIALALRPKR